MKKSLFLFALCMSLTASVCAQQGHFDGKSWWNHVKVLADDNMEGRETGSTGLKKAEAYVVEQLKKDGLQPAGVNGFYQPVKFESRELDEKNSSLALVRNGKAEPLALGDDAIFGTRIDLAPSVEAPLVFVGYGMDVPEKNYSDLAGLDLKGKVAVIMAGSPAEIPGALSSHYQSPGERWNTFKKAGDYCIFRRVGDRDQQRGGHVLADDRCRLQQTLVIWRQPVDDPKSDVTHCPSYTSVDNRSVPF